MEDELKRVISFVVAFAMAMTIFSVPVMATGTNNSSEENVAAVTEDVVAEPNAEENIEENPGDNEGEDAPLPEAEYTVEIAKSNYAYTGKAVKPAITVNYGEETLKANEDYTVEYKDNVYPGTAQIVVTIIGTEKTITKEFTIAKIEKFYAASTGTNAIKLAWTKMSNVTGYKLYSYNFSKASWDLKKTITGNKNNTYTVRSLGAGLGYQYKVVPYVKVGTNVYNGLDSAVLKAATRPKTVSITSVTSKPTLQATVKWGKATSTGYQVLLSRSSKFSTYSKATVRSSSTLNTTFSKLGDGVTYYVKVRAYKTYGGKTTFGSWSKTKKFVSDGTRWYTSGGKKYYYKKGKKALGAWTISGDKYYFDKSTGVLLGASSTMWSKVKKQTSKTPYLICVSRELNRACVYKKVSGTWVLKYYWKCTTGAKSTRTPAGVYSVPKTKTHLRYFGEGLGYTCWYATRIVNRVYFHSVLYNTDSQTSIQDGRLGQSLSHGCIRLAKDNALWLYNNIDAGTKVVIY